MSLLDGIDREGEFVFPDQIEGQHRQEVKKQWENICAAAGLVDGEGNKTVRMHDLRHTYASVLASAGLSSRPQVMVKKNRNDEIRTLNVETETSVFAI